MWKNSKKEMQPSQGNDSGLLLEKNSSGVYPRHAIERWESNMAVTASNTNGNPWEG